MSETVTPVPMHPIHGGSALTTRGLQRMRSAYRFEGPAHMQSGDLGFRVFLNHREREVARATH